MSSIKTDRLLLRPAINGDLEQLHAVFSNAQAMRYWSRLPHSDISETARFIDGMITIPFEQGEDFVVEFNDMIIGKVGFWKLPEIGYIFHPDYWGMGLATEAISALIEYGFQKRRIQAIVADVDPRNLSSIRLLEKHGFRETHRAANTVKIGEEWCDSVYFALKPPNP
ncbi:GNAT family N-acetyltransferase [Litoreibacter sp.]|nr:GNAT family N-acetyltransferase [Litoreibacter sp.]